MIRTSPDQSTPERLASLDGELRQIVREFRPSAVAVERVFVQANVTSAVAVAQASGVAQVVGVTAGATVAEYSPNEVKQAVAGWGGADKKEIAEMVRMLLGLPEAPRPADAADAAAVALTHLAVSPVVAR